MSLYSSYPSHAYTTSMTIPAPAPPPPPPSYQHPHALLQHDPNAFRQFYASHLATLTFNSRPIIQNLSMIAQDFQRWSSIVGQCLEAHIRRVPPPSKLPGFYLLDSIAKNIYDPYASVFAPTVAALFLDTYRTVDVATQGKMEEMLVTWRSGGPHGRQLFGIVPQVAIERNVWGDATSPAHRQSQPHPPKKQVLAELEVALAQKERVLQTNPFDALAAQQVDTLYQLRNVVQASEVSVDDLNAIVKQLRSLSAPAVVLSQLQPAPAASVMPAPATMSVYGGMSSSFPSQPNALAGTAYGAPAVPQQAYAAYPRPELNPVPSIAASMLPPLASQSLALHLTGPPPPVPPPASGPGVPTVGSSNITQLFQSLLKAGILSDSSTPVQPASTTDMNTIVDPELEAARRYEEVILGMPVNLNSVDIVKQRPSVVPLLYNQLPVQCKQCAARFSDDKTGKKRMEDHLDVHFRQNSKANQSLGRGHSRSWFVGFDDWTHDNGTGESRSKRGNNGTAASVDALAEREMKLRASFVVVPHGEEAKPLKCPICKEPLQIEFLEDDEEWVWQNAIRANDKVYHATCHADAVSATNPLVQRLRTDIAGGRSRSRTPEHHAAPQATPIKTGSRSPEPRGIKRKVDSDGSLVVEDGTPPMKRIALAL